MNLMGLRVNRMSYVRSNHKILHIVLDYMVFKIIINSDMPAVPLQKLGRAWQKGREEMLSALT